jgi:hypothetical protein
MDIVVFKLYMPLKGVIVYISLTLLIAIWGPIEYVGLTPWTLSGYILAFLVIFFLGYHRGIKGGSLFSTKSQRVPDARILRLIKLCIFTVFCYKLIEFINLALSGGLSFSNVGQNYLNAYSDHVRGEGRFNVEILLRVIFQIPMYIALILGFWYFKKLSRFNKATLIGFILLTIVVNTIGQGKQKQLGDIIVFMLSIVLINSAVIHKENIIHHKNRSNKNIYIIITIVMVAFLSFTSILGSRSKAIGVDVTNIAERAHPLMQYKNDHPVFKLLGDDVGFGTAMLSSYFSQGYLGLSLAFNEPFVWTYGVGNSYSTTVLLQKGLGLPLTPEDSYPYRVGAKNDWGQTKWHTVFSWLASDFTFPGVLVFFYFLALIYGRCWKESVLYRNPVSILLFSLLNLAIIFIPANNQLLHSPEGVFAVFFIFMFWWLRRRRFGLSSPSK